MNIDNSIEVNDNQKKNIIKTKFIFNKKSDSLIKELSIIALLKGGKLNFGNIKGRNLINYNINQMTFWGYCNMNQFTETEFIFSKSKEEAKNLIKNLNDIKEKNDAISMIYKALSYDNTNRYIFSRVLNKLFKLGAKEEYYNIIKEYRMVICEEDLIKNGNNLSINEFFIPKNEKEMKNYFINLLILLVKLYDKDSR